MVGESVPRRAVAWLVLAGAGVLLSMPAIAASMEESAFKSCWELLNEGKQPEAVVRAEDVLQGRNTENLEVPHAKALRERLKTIDDVAGRLTHKLNLIFEGVNGHRSPLAYLAPTPSELFAEIRRDLSASDSLGMDTSGDPVTARLIEAYLAKTDRGVLHLYGAFTSNSEDETAVSQARAYLSAYLVALHGDSNLPQVLEVLAISLCDGEMPLFLLHDMRTITGSFRHQLRLLETLDAADWARWPEEVRTLTLQNMAQRALEQGDYPNALTAYRKIISAEEGSLARVALRRLIDVYAEYAGKLAEKGNRSEVASSRALFSHAADACGEYMGLFPEAEDRETVEYSRIVYAYKAGEYQFAIGYAEDFRQRFLHSSATADVIFMQGLCTYARGNTEGSIELLKKVINEYSSDPVAAQAVFTVGQIYFRMQEYDLAEEYLLRVVDYYGSAKSAGEARKLLRRIP